MNAQGLFTRGAMMALAVSACAAAANATPGPAGSGGGPVSHIDPHGGSILQADNEDSYVRGSKLNPHLEATTTAGHGHHTRETGAGKHVPRVHGHHRRRRRAY